MKDIVLVKSNEAVLEMQLEEVKSMNKRIVRQKLEKYGILSCTSQKLNSRPVQIPYSLPQGQTYENLSTSHKNLEIERDQLQHPLHDEGSVLSEVPKISNFDYKEYFKSKIQNNFLKKKRDFLESKEE